MRYGLMSFVMLLFGVGVGHAQESKGKDKDGKVPFVEPTEVLGKTFKEWVKEFHHKDPSRREEAMQTILAFGPERAYEAVPDILREINKQKTLNVDLAVRVNGIVTLSTILKHQKKADPALLKEALVTYKMCLKDTQAILRVRTVQGLPALGPIAHEAIEDVITVARDPATWELRKEGLQTLTIIAFNDKGVPTPKLLPELRRALDDPSVQVRLTALNAIGLVSHANITKADESANLAKLIAHLKVEDDKAGLIWTHVTIMSASKEVNKKHVEPIAAALKDSDAKARTQALTALSSIGPKAKPWCRAAVEEAIDDPNPSIGISAIGALVHIHAGESIPVLQRLVNNKKANQLLRETAEDAIDQLKLLASKTKDK